MSAPARTQRKPGISCDHCKATIERRVAPVAGVAAFAVGIDAMTVAVMGGGPTAIVGAIEAAGYDVS